MVVRFARALGSFMLLRLRVADSSRRYAMRLDGWEATVVPEMHCGSLSAQTRLSSVQVH